MAVTCPAPAPATGESLPCGLCAHGIGSTQDGRVCDVGSHWVGTGKRPGARSHISSGPVPPPVQWDGKGRRGRVFWAWAPCSPPTLSLESGAQVALGGQTGKSITEARSSSQGGQGAWGTSWGASHSGPRVGSCLGPSELGSQGLGQLVSRPSGADAGVGATEDLEVPHLVQQGCGGAAGQGAGISKGKLSARGECLGSEGGFRVNPCPVTSPRLLTQGGDHHRPGNRSLTHPGP